MNKEDLIELKEKLSKLSEEEQKQRDLHLKKMANSEIQGPPVGYSSIDKAWLKYYDDDSIVADVPKCTIYEYIKNTSKWVNNNQQDLNKKVAFNYFGRKISYNELYENVENISNQLLDYGIKEGDIVSIAMPSFPETIYLFYALSNIGAVANMIDPRTSDEGIENYVKEVGSKLLFIVDVAKDKVKNIKETTDVEDVVTISASDSLPQPLKALYNLKNNQKLDSEKFISWKTFTNKYSTKDQKKPDYKEGRTVAIVHTGGTTGNPKGVKLTNENLNAASIQCVNAGYDFQAWHNWLNIMPPFIAYGIGNGLHLPLACGMEVILIPAFNPAEFDKLLIKYKPNHMVGVPSHYGDLMKSKKLDKQDLSFVIAPVVGGDKMDEELEQQVNEYLEKHNCDYKIVKGYGLTEVNAAVAACTSNENNKIGSVGIPFPNTNIAIFEPDTEEELSYGKTGEVCISGPNTMLGYYDNEEATKQMIKVHSDGTKWVHSGDLGYMDKDGNLFIIDRIKRMIVRPDGFKIFPSLIEDVINAIPNVKISKVVGVRDIDFVQGKVPKAHIVLENNDVDLELEKAKIMKVCMSKLPEYCSLAEIEFHDQLPLTPIGKIDYKKLEDEDSKIQKEKGYVK